MDMIPKWLSHTAIEVKDSGHELKLPEHLEQIRSRCTGRPPLGSLIRCQDVISTHPFGVERVIVNPDGKSFASSAGDGVKIWDLAVGQLLKELAGHRAAVSAVEMSGDGRLLAVGHEDGCIETWSLPSGTSEGLLKIDPELGVYNCMNIVSLAFSADGSLLASACYPGQAVHLWELPSRKHLGQFPKDGWQGEWPSVSISPDGQLLTVGTADELQIWELPDSECSKALPGCTGSLNSIAISPDGQLLVSVDSQRALLHLWSLPQGVLIKTLPGVSEVGGIVFTNDSKFLAVGGCEYGSDADCRSSDAPVRLWSLPGGELVASLSGHWRCVTAMAISPDGRTLLTGGESGSVRVWRLPDGVLIRSLEGHTKAITSLAVSPDGSKVVSASRDGTIRIWESELMRLCARPVDSTGPREWAWAEEALASRLAVGDEEAWLQLLTYLLRKKAGHESSKTAAAYNEELYGDSISDLAQEWGYKSAEDFFDTLPD